jgi:hypothetical protein
MADMAKLLGFGFDPDKDYRVHRVQNELELVHGDNCRDQRTCNCMTRIVKVRTLQRIQLREEQIRNWYDHTWFVSGR